jgi:hypothetical protein
MATNHRIPGTEIFASIATHHKPWPTTASFANHRQQPQPSPTTQTTAINRQTRNTIRPHKIRKTVNFVPTPPPVRPPDSHDEGQNCKLCSNHPSSLSRAGLSGHASKSTINGKL